MAVKYRQEHSVWLSVDKTTTTTKKGLMTAVQMTGVEGHASEKCYLFW